MAPTASRYLWCNAAYAMAANIARAFKLYGWCVRIRGIDSGGAVEGLPVLHFPDRRRRCGHEMPDRDRDQRTARGGAGKERAYPAGPPQEHRHVAAFIGAQSLQMPQEYDDPAATANANLSARLPYLFACCRFAHYLKCMVRDKVGSSMDKAQLSNWLQEWLLGYVDGAPDRSSEEWKAAHPLVERPCHSAGEAETRRATTRRSSSCARTTSSKA